MCRSLAPLGTGYTHACNSQTILRRACLHWNLSSRATKMHGTSLRQVEQHRHSQSLHKYGCPMCIYNRLLLHMTSFEVSPITS